jgi:hypothetical protein
MAQAALIKTDSLVPAKLSCTGTPIAVRKLDAAPSPPAPSVTGIDVSTLRQTPVPPALLSSNWCVVLRPTV